MAYGDCAGGFRRRSSSLVRSNAFTGSAFGKSAILPPEPHLIELRRAVVKNGVSKEAGKVNRGTQNYAFPAPPSTAVGVAQVLTANGRLDSPHLQEEPKRPACRRQTASDSN